MINTHRHSRRQAEGNPMKKNAPVVVGAFGSHYLWFDSDYGDMFEPSNFSWQVAAHNEVPFGRSATISHNYAIIFIQ